MSSITFKIEEAKKANLEETAKGMNLSMDELIQTAIDHFLLEKEKRFQEARAYTRKRYHQLHKRLA